MYSTRLELTRAHTWRHLFCGCFYISITKATVYISTSSPAHVLQKRSSALTCNRRRISAPAEAIPYRKQSIETTALQACNLASITVRPRVRTLEPPRECSRRHRHTSRWVGYCTMVLLNMTLLCKRGGCILWFIRMCMRSEKWYLANWTLNLFACLLQVWKSQHCAVLHL